MQAEEKPVWKVDLEKHEFPKLENNLKTDVVIVGGGLAGVLTAYKLVQSGKKVVILEKKRVGSGATEYTTAFITQEVDTDLQDLVKLFGKETARLVWQSGVEAIGLLEKIVTEENIDCDFKRVSEFLYASSEDQYTEIEEEQKLAKEFGFAVSEMSKDNRLSFSNFGYFEIKNQAKFHPLKFLNNLAEKCERMGVQIFERSEVEKIQHKKNQVVALTKTNQVEAEHVVVATYQPFHNRIRLFLKRGMYKSYVVEAKLPKGLVAEGLYLDNNNPYHYFRIDPREDYDSMILGGEDVKSMFKIDKEKCFAALEDYLKSILPGVKYEISRKWVGPILEPSDGLPLIGQTYEREFVASAFSGNGMTYSAIAAQINSDKILGRDNIYARIYDPKRIPSFKQLFIKGSDYVEEFFGGVGKNLLEPKIQS